MSKSKVSNTVRGDNSASWLKRFFHSGIILYIILIVLAVIYIMPFVTQIATSFKTDADATANPVSLVPEIWTTAAYKKLFLNSDFPVWFKNSFIVTIVVTLGRVFFDSLAGYALARIDFRGRNVVFSLLLAVMSVPIGAAYSEVPHHQEPWHLRQLCRHDSAVAHRCDRRVHHEEFL